MFWNTGPKEKKSLLERLVRIEYNEDELGPAPVAETAVARRFEPEPALAAEDRVTVIDMDRRFMAEPASEEAVVTEMPVESVQDAPFEARTVEIQRPQVAKNTYFDILERAKEMPGDAREEIKIVYTVPKRVIPVRQEWNPEPVRHDADEYVVTEIPVDGASAETVQGSVERILESVDVDAVPEIVAPREPAFAEAAPVFEGFAVETPVAEAAMPEMPVSSAPTVETVAVSEEPVATFTDPVTGGEAVVSRRRTLEKIVFPEEYFYAKNGHVIKSASQLHEALEAGHLDDETLAHHMTSRDNGMHDFANWVMHVFDHRECAYRIKWAKDRKELARILREYL